MVDNPDLESGAARCESSSLSVGTNIKTGYSRVGNTLGLGPRDRRFEPGYPDDVIDRDDIVVPRKVVYLEKSMPVERRANTV